MKAIWTGLFLLGFVLSVACSMITTPNALTTTTPSAGTLSVASDTRSVTNEQAATPTLPMGLGTVQAFRTGFAETRTRAQTVTTTPTNTPSPTCTPPPVYFSPAATFLPRPNKTVTETLAADMLQILMAARPGHGAPKFSMIDDPFQIEMLDESIDADWDTERVSVNWDKTLTVFYSHAPGPEPSAEDLDELFKWRRARKWFVQDHEIGKTYRLKWQDYDLTGPSIDVESWVSKEVLVMSQFEYPRYSGFLVAIDVRAKKVLLVLQVEYGCWEARVIRLHRLTHPLGNACLLGRLAVQHGSGDDPDYDWHVDMLKVGVFFPNGQEGEFQFEEGTIYYCGEKINWQH